jgi:hypothetical protein
MEVVSLGEQISKKGVLQQIKFFYNQLQYTYIYTTGSIQFTFVCPRYKLKRMKDEGGKIFQSGQRSRGGPITALNF